MEDFHEYYWKDQFKDKSNQELNELLDQYKFDRKHIGFGNQTVWNHCQYMIRGIKRELNRREKEIV